MSVVHAIADVRLGSLIELPRSVDRAKREALSRFAQVASELFATDRAAWADVALAHADGSLLGEVMVASPTFVGVALRVPSKLGRALLTIGDGTDAAGTVLASARTRLFELESEP